LNYWYFSLKPQGFWVMLAEVLTNQASQTPVTDEDWLRLAKIFTQNQTLKLKITPFKVIFF